MPITLLKTLEAPLPNSSLRAFLLGKRPEYLARKAYWEKVLENFHPDAVSWFRSYRDACYKIHIIDAVLLATPGRPVHMEEICLELYELYGPQFDEVRFLNAWAVITHYLMHSVTLPGTAR